MFRIKPCVVSFRRIIHVAIYGLAILLFPNCSANELLKTHCQNCHSGLSPKGGFEITSLGTHPTAATHELWRTCLEYVDAGEMPPPKSSKLSPADRKKLVQFLRQNLKQHPIAFDHKLPPRRLNNRELLNSVSDILQIEDPGTHRPAAGLLGDTLHHGFDTHGDTLGMSEYHLDQYVNVFRRIVEATLLTGDQPKSKRVVVSSDDLRLTESGNRARAERANRTNRSIEILDMRKHVYFANFEEVPASGRYRLQIRAAGIDRTIYDWQETGHYPGDPIRLRVHMGDRTRDFDLKDEEETVLELNEWLAAGTRIKLSYPTDALRLKGNGNFKFQYRIAHDYLQKHNRVLYDRVVREEVPRAKTRSTVPGHWVHWTGYWQGPRPRLFGAEIEGPFYESWPPARHRRLIGSAPKIENAESILIPIAERAWRRAPQAGELDRITRLVQTRASEIGTVQAFREGVIAILVSPSFLLLGHDDLNDHDRYAARLSSLFSATIPSADLRQRISAGELEEWEAVLKHVRTTLKSEHGLGFMQAFPYQWLQLDRINFMSPDPVQFPLYDRKRLSEDMIEEVRQLFRHAVKNNVPLPELLTADYSFINADLAAVYEVKVPLDSKFRRHQFKDGRRGGLLGTGAFLTLTADSLSTSPIHRAVYVMETFLDIKPSPPPADVEISEPDIRQARTIREILSAHAADPNCSACHRRIDPWGYAFENFDPVGAWRENYTSHLQSSVKGERRSGGVPVDTTAEFLDGTRYTDIREFRELLKSDVNQARFTRCFIVRLLTFANGVEPRDEAAIDRILETSARHDYRIVETIAAVVHSPLFRETPSPK